MLVAERCDSYSDYLREIRILKDSEIATEFRELDRSVSSDRLRGKLESIWCMLVCYFFLGYRVTMPRWMIPATRQFDTLAEFTVALHVLIGIATGVLTVVMPFQHASLVATALSAVTWLALARTIRIEAIAAKASELALQNWLVPIALNPSSLLVRRKLTFLSYSLHDLRFFLIFGTYVGMLLWVPIVFGPFILVPLLGFYGLAVANALLLIRTLGSPPCLTNK